MFHHCDPRWGRADLRCPLVRIAQRRFPRCFRGAPSRDGQGEDIMNLRMVGFIFCVCSLAALGMPGQSAAQETPSPKVKHQRYRIVTLGTDGGADSFLAGYLFYAPLNNLGAIGVYGDTSVAGAFNSYTWTYGKQTDLQALPVQAGSAPSTYINWINQLGFAVGYAANGVQDPIVGGTENEAVLWAPNGQIFNLGTLGGYQSHAIWVNDFGQVSG